MKLFIGVLVLLFCMLQYNLWFDPSGILATIRLQEKLDHQLSQNNVLKKRNDALNIEINDLKSGHDSVEEHARNELGMIKQDEVFYRYVEQ